MIKLLESGYYLLNGTELVPDDAESARALQSKTGQAVTKEALLTGSWKPTILPAI